MGDAKDFQLLQPPFKCLFCSEQCHRFTPLLIHLLSIHPVEYHLLKHLSKKRLSFTSEELRKISLEPGEIDMDSPPPSKAQPPIINLEDSPTEPTPQESSSSTTEAGPSRGSRGNSREKGSECGSSGSRRSSSKGERRLGVGKCGVRAERCRHNDTNCGRFPYCAGRLCPFRHPRCPDKDQDFCLLNNDCPFYHFEYEMSCSECPRRLHPKSLRPILIHCPHSKLKECWNVERCKRIGSTCLHRHGICANQDDHLPKSCFREHLFYYYFCRNCKDYTKYSYVNRP